MWEWRWVEPTSTPGPAGCRAWADSINNCAPHCFTLLCTCTCNQQKAWKPTPEVIDWVETLFLGKISICCFFYFLSFIAKFLIFHLEQNDSTMFFDTTGSFIMLCANLFVFCCNFSRLFLNSRTYSKRNQIAPWQRHMNFCKTKVKTKRQYAHGRRLLDLVDLHILDYLIGEWFCICSTSISFFKSLKFAHKLNDCSQRTVYLSIVCWTFWSWVDMFSIFFWKFSEKNMPTDFPLLSFLFGWVCHFISFSGVSVLHFSIGVRKFSLLCYLELLKLFSGEQASEDIFLGNDYSVEKSTK